jgi:hypothetical protein
MAEWIEVPAHRIYVICARELRDGFDYIRENGRPARRTAKIPTVSYERRTAKFLSGPASLRNIPKFITARRSKRYDFKELGDQRSYGNGRAFCFSETLYQRPYCELGKSFRHAHIPLTEYEAGAMQGMD